MGTSMEVLRTIGNGGGGGSGGLPTLIEKTQVVTIAGGDNKYIPIPVGHDRYDIRTISVQNTVQNISVASIYDKSIGGIKVYQSLEEINTYDILNVPCEDKDGKQTCHLFIQNKSGVSAEYTIIIKLTNLL